MAALAGSDHSELAVDSDDLADGFAASVIHAEAPANNSHGIAKFLLSRAVRDAGYKVVLTGEGADEVLFGYPHFRQDLLLRDSGHLDEAERQRRLQDLRDRNAVSLGRLVAGEEPSPSPALEATLGFVPAWLQVHFAGMASRNLPLDYGYLKAAAPRDPAQILLSEIDVERRLKGRRAVEQSGYLWAKTMLPNYMLSILGDRSEMAHSVEGRVPFLDHEVGQFLNAVPVEAKIKGRVEKHLLRLAVRDVVTDRVFRRQKHPFLGPPVDLQPGSRFFELAQDTLRSAKAGEVPFLDVPKLWRLADDLPRATPQQRIAVEPRLLYVMSILFLQRRFSVGA
jgi:asparagine synthase (glutamine-hydrolysing)